MQVTKPKPKAVRISVVDAKTKESRNTTVYGATKDEVFEKIMVALTTKNNGRK
jgi:hypothetical protein